MAMIDYGCVVKRNGKIINEGAFFMDMEKNLGFCIKSIDDMLVAGDYFAFVGDEKFFIGFYKTYAVLFTKHDDGRYTYFNIPLDDWSIKLPKGYDCCWYKINDRVYRLSFDTPTDKWEALFGYGVDNNFKTQLDVAFEYGFSPSDIEEIIKFWNKAGYVKGIKTKYRRKYRRIERKYVYKFRKGYYNLTIKYTDKNTGEDDFFTIKYKENEFNQACEDYIQIQDQPLVRDWLPVNKKEGYYVIFEYVFPAMNTHMHSTSEKYDDITVCCREIEGEQNG